MFLFSYFNIYNLIVKDLKKNVFLFEVIESKSHQLICYFKCLNIMAGVVNRFRWNSELLILLWIVICYILMYHIYKNSESKNQKNHMSWNDARNSLVQRKKSSNVSDIFSYYLLFQWQSRDMISIRIYFKFPRIS